MLKYGEMTPRQQEDLVRRAAVLHDALTKWLRFQVPQAEAVMVLTALTYECGRIAGQLSEGMSDAEIETMLDDIRDTMRDHVDAYRKGLRT
jgi:hypothetical protein